MKSFAIVLVVCLVGAINASIYREHRNACLTEAGVDPGLERIEDNQVTDPKLACFSACMYTKMGIMNADGTFNEEGVRLLLPSDFSSEKANAAVNLCKNVTGVDVCDTGRKLYKCYVEKGKTITGMK